MVKPNTIFTGDNLPILRGMDTSSVDLIYLDPPFNSKRDYAAPVGSKAAGAEFKDTWTPDDTDDAWWGEIAERNPALYKVIDAAGAVGGKGDKAYCIYMAMRLLEMHRVLKPSGSIYYHCDPTMSHSVKLVMDAIFGAAGFRNEIAWCYSGGGVPKRDFPRKHDVVFRYVNGADWVFHIERKPYKENTRHVGKHSALSGGIAIDLEKGTPVTDWWSDLKTVTGWAAEKQGYPTQKPLALLKRIVQASSNPGDLVLDPFCGCATACVAAQHEGRNWIGIDISPRAFDITKARFEKELDLFNPKIIHRMDIPTRSDQQKRSKNIKHILFGRQQGICNGCLYEFMFRNFQIDHIVARDHGGSDADENLQLLCGFCNNLKGTGTMQELIAKLIRMGIRKQP
ncbi:MAG: DNA methyltransferase [Gammaproteobacteria bacterium]